MGYPKALLPINGDYAVVSLAKILAQRLELFITLPHFLLKQPRLRSLLALYGAQVYPNHYEHEGFSGSIRTVLEKVKGADGIVIIPVDTPFLTPSLLLALINIAAFHKKTPHIIIPYAYCLPGHPVYFSRHFFKELIRGHKLGGPRAIIKRNQKYVHRIFWSDARILHNLNQQQDLDSMAYNQTQL